MGDDAHAISTDPGDTLLFENDRVRVWSMTLEGHAAGDFHRHLHDHFILWPDPGEADAQLAGDEGWTMHQTARSGYIAFKTVGADGLTPHRLRNRSDRPVTHYIIELLGPSAGDVEQRAVTNGRGRTIVTATEEAY